VEYEYQLGEKRV